MVQEGLGNEGVEDVFGDVGRKLLGHIVHVVRVSFGKTYIERHKRGGWSPSRPGMSEGRSR